MGANNSRAPAVVVKRCRAQIEPLFSKGIPGTSMSRFVMHKYLCPKGRQWMSLKIIVFLEHTSIGGLGWVDCASMQVVERDFSLRDDLVPEVWETKHGLTIEC